MTLHDNYIPYFNIYCADYCMSAVSPTNVKRITRYVESVEPGESTDDTMSAEEFFSKHFNG